MAIDIPTENLTSLNLRTEGSGYAITWPPDTNIFHMTLGKHLGAETRDMPAMIFEAVSYTHLTLPTKA